MQKEIKSINQFAKDNSRNEKRNDLRNDQSLKSDNDTIERERYDYNKNDDKNRLITSSGGSIFDGGDVVLELGADENINKIIVKNFKF